MADALVGQKYSDAASHFAAYQLSSLVKKYDFPKGSFSWDPEMEARKKFLDAEARCAEVNKRFLEPQRFNVESTPDLALYLARARGWIQYVIGETPSMFEIYSKCGFGPGASIGTHGNATHIAAKLSGVWSVSPSALKYAEAAVASNAQLVELLLSSEDGRPYCLDPDDFQKKFKDRISVTNYNKIAFVPKTAKTHRSIAVEPLLNSYVQKGIDETLRLRLQRIGIDLSDQERNCEFARQGSLTDGDNGFATIDLSSASDSVSTELVRYLLPPAWFDLLDQTRSKNYLDGDVVRPYHKFCSMGNGFCFPLETLIFTSLAYATRCGKPGTDFLVYGDDIIVRQDYAPLLVDVLDQCGFSVNTDKTFIRGPFRESCGRDWFVGEDVRPFVLDFRLDSLQALFKFLNLTQRNERTSMFFREAVDYVKSLIPRCAQFCRPFEGGDDTGYTVEWDEFLASPFAEFHRGKQCWSWLELRQVPISDKDAKRTARGVILTMAALQGASSAKPFTFRRKTGTKVDRVIYSSFKTGATINLQGWYSPKLWVGMMPAQ